VTCSVQHAALLLTHADTSSYFEQVPCPGSSFTLLTNDAPTQDEVLPTVAACTWHCPRDLRRIKPPEGDSQHVTPLSMQQHQPVLACCTLSCPALPSCHLPPARLPPGCTRAR
jgi:hypothetical protein